MRPLLLALASLLTAASAHAQTEAPTLILHDAVVVTADPERPRAEALAISGERIVAVGPRAEVLALAGPETLVLALDGRLVVPGLNDAHVHVGPWPSVERPDLDGMADPSWDVVLDSVRAVAAHTSAGTWIQGEIGGTVLDDPVADRFALDQAAPDHPVMLSGWTGHGMILNTAALSAVGFSLVEPDPPGGGFGRVAGTDTLDGRLWEYPQFEVFRRLADPLPRAAAVRSYRRMAGRLVRWGVTSVQQMENIRPLGETMAALAEADVPLRWGLFAWPMPRRSLDEARPDTTRPADLPDRVRVVGTKWVLDGTPIERFAALRQPYADRPDWSGRINFTDAELRTILQSARDRDEITALHIVGDATLEQVMDTMEALAPADVWRTKRVRIEHGEGLAPDLLPRAAALGMVLVQNPLHFDLPDVMAARYGADRMPEIQLLRSAAEAGVTVALGADAGGSGQNPWLNLMMATLHPVNPAEALSREDALAAYTRGGAYAEGAESEKGMLREGMQADLAVLSQNILEVPPDALPATESVLTVIGGEIVYRAETDSLREVGQGIVDTFGALAAVAGTDLGPTPTVEVRTTPFLIFYEGQPRRIVMPWWADLPPPVQGQFAHFAGSDDGAEPLFRTFFHRFFVAHEAGHWVQDAADRDQGTLYANEDHANRIAVAFWETQPGGEAFLSDLEQTLVAIVERIPDPTPAGEDPVAYFDAHYHELGRDPMKYGYYQFRFVLDAVRQRDGLDLARLVGP